MTPPVYHTDVTKVLSADSHIAGLYSPDSSATPPTDPNAPQDFVDIVDIVANDTRVQYLPAPSQSGLLSRACVYASVKTEGIRPAVPPPTRKPSEVTKDAERYLPFFMPLTQSETSISQLARWVRFQVSTSYLQGIFWAGNDEQELRDAVDVYKRHHPTSTALLDKAVSTLGGNPFGYAASWLRYESWTPVEFFVAYAFWAYIKGCRFAKGLTEVDIYVAHWLRESALTKADGASVTSLAALDVRIPWGPIVRHQLEPLPSSTLLDALTEALIDLRQYSVRELKHADTRDRREDFLVEGVVPFRATMGLSRGFGADDLADKAADLSGSKSLRFLAQIVTRTVTKARAKKMIKWLAKIHGRVKDFIEQGP